MKYIPISQIAELTPYSEGHLILWARRGKLKAIEHNGEWFTTLEWMDDFLLWLNERIESARGHSMTIGEAEPEISYQKSEIGKEIGNQKLVETPVISDNQQPISNNQFPHAVEQASSVMEQTAAKPAINANQLLSMVEAEKYCDYSAAYLSLRVRQGKLKGKKQGRNWYTTLDWINEYVVEHGAKENAEAQPAVATPVVSAPAPVLASTPESPITNFQSPVKFQFPISKIIQPVRLFGHWLLEIYWNLKIGIWKFVRQQTASLVSLAKTKAFQTSVAALTVAGLIFFSLSSPSVRASFYDWSAAAVSQAKHLSKQASVAIATAAHTASTKLADVSTYLSALGGPKFQSTIASISLPSFTLPHLALPNISLPNIHLPPFSIPQISLPHLALPDIHLPHISLSQTGRSFSEGWPHIALPDFSPFLTTLAQLPERLSVILEHGRQQAAVAIASSLDSIRYRPAGSSVQNDTGIVLGESTDRLAVADAPLPSPESSSNSVVSIFSSLLSPFRLIGGQVKSAVNFLNPNNPSSLIARLSGSVSEIGQSISQADPLTKVSSSVTSFLSSINVGKVLQPAGSFLARLVPSPAGDLPAGLAGGQGEGRDGQTQTTPESNPADTQVSGELSLQPASSLTPDKSVAVLPTNQPSSLRYRQPLQNLPLTPSLVKEGAPTSGTLAVSTPSGYFTLTDPNTIQTAKTIHSLANLIADGIIMAKELKVATLSSPDLSTPLTISAPNTTITGSLTVLQDTKLQNLNVNGTLTANSFNPQSINTTSLTTSSLSSDFISTKSVTATGSLSGSSFSGQFGSFTNLSSNGASFGGNNTDTFLSKSPSTFESSLTVQGAAALTSSLAVTGATTLTGAASLASTLTVAGAATLQSTLAVTGASTFTGLLTASGGITLTGSLTASATSTASAFVSTSSMATSTLAGNLAINGQTNITGTSTLATTTINNLAITSTTATTTLAGGLAIETSGLVYDYSTNRVGIGIAAPSYLLHLQSTASPQLAVGYDSSNYFTTAVAANGDVAFNTNGATGAAFAFQDNLTVASTTANQFKTGYDATNYLAFTTDAGGTTTLSVIGGQFASLKVASALRVATSSAFALEIQDGNGTKLLTANTLTNRIGVGTTTPGALFAVTGNSLFDGSVSTFGILTASSFTATSTTATSTFSTGGLAIGTSQFVVQQTSGRVGIGMAAPLYPLHLQNATSPQLALAYDGSSYYTTAVSATGAITFTRYGSALANGFTFNDTLNVATSTTETILTVNGTNTANATTTLAVYQAGTGRAFYINRPNTSQTLTAPLVEFVTATSTALSLISQSGSASSTLAVYQQGTGPIVLLTDTNLTTPAFRIAAISRDLEVRSDYVQLARKSLLTSIANINDVFVYDTTKDSDGGKWRNDNKAQGSSWYNETLDATAASCSVTTDDRCGRKEFPEKATLVATNDALYIFDAKDNSMWMKFSEGSTASSTMSIIGGTSSTHSSVTAFNGTIYLANSASTYDGGVVAIDFSKDTASFYGSAINGKLAYNSNLSNRNSTTAGYTTSQTSLSLVNAAVNDVYVQVISGKHYIAAATDGGVSIINETDKLVFNSSDTQKINNLYLTSQGELYYSFTEFSQARVKYKVQNISSSKWTTDVSFIDTTTIPSLNAQYINDIYAIEDGSFIDPNSNKVIWATNAAGVIVYDEKQGDETKGAVKYYQTATTTEEMIGDIRGMWPMNNLSDASVKGNTLTNTGSVTFTASGVRGTAATFNGSSQYLSCTDASCGGTTKLDYAGSGGWTMGVWAKPSSIGTDDIIFGKGNAYWSSIGATGLNCTSGKFGFSGYSGSAWTCASSTTSPAVSTWYYVVGTYDNATIKIYVNGQLEGSALGTGLMGDSVSSFDVGGASSDIATWGFPGVIDEPFVTATALTASQIKYMYEVGKRALANHTSGTITGVSGADSYQQLYGTTNIVKAISVDTENNLLYAATSDGSTAAGGVSALGLGSDSLTDVWGLGGGTGPAKVSDTGVAWDSTASYSQVNTLSVAPRYPKTLAIGTAGMLWLETEPFSLDKYRSESYNPHGETLTQTNLTVNYKLDVGNELAVYGTVLGASTGGGQNNVLSLQQKPTFRVSSDGTVTVRDDLLFTGRTTLTSLSNINDVFVYDTTKDTDGGEWTCNDIARATSWYNEPLNTATRGKTRCFPRKAVIVGTNTTVNIYDAKDNSLWLEFIRDNDNDMIRGVVSSVFALNGALYASSNTTGGLHRVDFVRDIGDLFATNGQWRYKSNISERNNNPGTFSINSSMAIVNNTVNDVSAAVVNGKTYVAVATNSGVSVINETDGTVASDSQASKVFNIWLTNKGALYSSTDSPGGDTVIAKYNVQNIAAGSAADKFGLTLGGDKYYRHDTTPAIRTAIGTDPLLNLFVTEGTSTIDPTSNTIYIGQDTNLAVIQEKQGDESNGSVKYYTKDYISEEMVGDIRGMWPMYEQGGTNVADVSVKGHAATASGTTVVSGVRGWARSFNGTSDYIDTPDHNDFSFGNGTTDSAFSVGAWVNFSNVTSRWIMSKYDDTTGNTNKEWHLYTDSSGKLHLDLFDDSAIAWEGRYWNTALTTNLWNYVVTTYDGTGGSSARNGIKIYVNGVRVDDTTNTGGTYVAMENKTAKLAFGYSTNTAGAKTGFFSGIMDEPFITAETLTPAQIKRMYETGKRALEGGVEGVAANATSAHTAFRIGVAGGAVKYTAGQFIGSVIQVYGSGAATSTRFVTQTASSTSDYYIQFSPDHTATIANNNTFSIGPNALQGDSNRVTALAVDDMRDFIYVGTNSGAGVGMVSKISLDSDTVTDVWNPSVGKNDDANQPYAMASTTTISLAGNTLAIGANDSSNGGFWSEYQSETLDHKLNGPKSVFTVIDKIQTPKISSVTGVLTINTGINVAGTNGLASSTSLTIGTATSTLNTIQIKAGPSQNLLLSGDSNNGLYVSSAGNVGIGTTSPLSKLQVAKDANTISGASVDTTAQFNITGATDPKKRLQMGFDTTGDFGFIRAVHVDTAVKSLILQPDTGNVGIGTTTPAYLLDVYGSTRINNGLNVGTATGAGTGDISFSGNANFSAVSATSRFQPIPSATVTTSWTTLGSGSSAGIGEFYYLVWYNVSDGSQGHALFMTRQDVATQVAIADGTGLGVTFQIEAGSTGRLQVKTTSGTIVINGISFVI